MKKRTRSILITKSGARKANPKQNFHRAIIETLNDYAVFTTNNDGIIQSWNAGAKNIFGYKEAEILGKNYSHIFGSDDQKKKVPEKLLAHALHKSRTIHARSYVRKNHSPFWANGIIFPIEDEDRAHSGFTIILSDISEQKEFEDRRDEFIGNATHEIRTPITAMKLFANIVKNKTKKIDSTSLNESVSGLNDQIDRLVALTDYLLDVSKIQGGKLTLNKTFFDINRLVRSLIVTMRFTSSKHILTMHSNVKKKIYADEERISQVITNLISNAIKYSPKGGEIIITIKQEANAVVISVQDFGVGISEGEQHGIFTRFFRADIARKVNISGIGLGLYIARKIVTAHHGKMGMVSIKGKGSTFHFTLPAKPLIRR